MSSQSILLTSDDVIGIDPENFEGSKVFKTITPDEIRELMKRMIGSNKETILFTEGMEAKVLRPGDGWKTGKIKLSIEFCPNEPEIKETEVSNNTQSNTENSPLDDLREQLKNVS
jgi:hypothetical protein